MYNGLNHLYGGAVITVMKTQLNVCLPQCSSKHMAPTCQLRLANALGLIDPPSALTDRVFACCRRRRGALKQTVDALFQREVEGKVWERFTGRRTCREKGAELLWTWRGWCHVLSYLRERDVELLMLLELHVKRREMVFEVYKVCVGGQQMVQTENTRSELCKQWYILTVFHVMCGRERVVMHWKTGFVSWFGLLHWSLVGFLPVSKASGAIRWFQVSWNCWRSTSTLLIIGCLNLFSQASYWGSKEKKNSRERGGMFIRSTVSLCFHHMFSCNR